MKLSTEDFGFLCQHAISAAKQAGQIISAYTGRSVSVKTKQGRESLASQVVTEVDHLCQESILKILLPTCHTFDLALLAEESADDLKRLEKDYFWCIDPLDGTLPFIESTPGYSVSIALVARDGTPYIGVIYDPVKKVLYHAINGKGAFRNGKRWEHNSSPVTTKRVFTLIADRSFKQDPFFHNIMEEIEAIAKDMAFSKVDMIIQGGAAMNACWVLENAPACYFKLPKSEKRGGSLWDFSASACVFVEMGSIVSDIEGAPLDLNRHDSTFMNHRGIIYASEIHISEKIKDFYTKLKLKGKKLP